MTAIDRYRRGLIHCGKKAGEAPSEEIQELWLSLMASYRFLLQREQRVAPAP